MKAAHLAVVAFLAVLALPRSAAAADIFLWTDENGRTHLADSVPPQHRKAAIRIDSSQFELSPEQQRDAAASRAALARQASAPPASPPANFARPAGAIAPSSSGVAASAASGSDCEARQREYRESLECFAPYVNANGSLKPGAFAACKSVVNPTLTCGSPKAY